MLYNFRFLEHGSDIIETLTYQASVKGFMEHLGVTKDDALQLIKNSVELAKRACIEVCKEKRKSFSYYNIVDLQNFQNSVSNVLCRGKTQWRGQNRIIFTHVQEKSKKISIKYSL